MVSKKRSGSHGALFSKGKWTNAKGRYRAKNTKGKDRQSKGGVLFYVGQSDKTLPTRWCLGKALKAVRR